MDGSKAILLLLLALGASLSRGADLTITSSYREGDFKLVAAKEAAAIYISEGDFKVAQIAAECLAADMERVSGTKPGVHYDAQQLSGNAVLIGTLGKSALIDELARSGKLDAVAITGKWESFVVAVVDKPLPGVPQGLVIAGSDRRGTAYGVFELSEAMGVSPWYWWADVTPRRLDTLVVPAGTYPHGSPSVKYRGIFINDEDWGLQPWAAKTFEPETGDIGPKTYAKVCELLLRLKGNYLWPAMHPSTKAFNLYSQNKVVADDYAIVMGSSHAEPMLRNNVSEWDGKARGEWDYEKNREGMMKYWEERVVENGQYENVYTIGMRGIHDSAMPGEGTMAEKVSRLQRVLSDQRDLLAKHVNHSVQQVPQVFVPYKEALELYDHGLQVPDDVTLVWPDDNHGYIRHFSTLAEQKRSGGAGVYYHLSYWGKPEDYLWLCTTPPALVWEEMTKAYEYGARDVWVANVGDIKPAEIGMELFLRMAWDAGRYKSFDQRAYLAGWAGRTFGSELATALGGILDEYYRLNYSAKPEHLMQAQFSWHNYEEASNRLQRFSNLVEKTNALYEKVRPEMRDAFYQLVVYPVRCSGLMNQKHLYAAAAREGELADAGRRAEEAHEQIQAETKHYNELAGGKWNRIMSASPRNRPMFAKPNLAPTRAAAASSPTPGDSWRGKAVPKAFKGFVEKDSCVSMEAENYSRAIPRQGASWKVVEGLGRTGNSITVYPVTTPAVTVTGDFPTLSPALEYDFLLTQPHAAKVLAYCVPTHATSGSGGLHYAVAIDQETPRLVNIETKEFSNEWSANVLRGAAIGTSTHEISGDGQHTLHIWMADPGVVLDKIVIDLGGVKPSQLGPPETRP